MRADFALFLGGRAAEGSRFAQSVFGPHPERMTLQGRRHGRAIRNLGQRDLLALRVPDRTVLRIVGLNSKRLLARWKAGAEIPTPERRLALERELGIPQLSWLRPATDADQQDAAPAPPPAEVASAANTGRCSRYAHVPPMMLFEYSWLQDVALFGRDNAARLYAQQPIVTAERPSALQVTASLYALERWLIGRKQRSPEGDDGKRASYQGTLDRIFVRGVLLPEEAITLGATAAQVAAQRPDPLIAELRTA